MSLVHLPSGDILERSSPRISLCWLLRLDRISDLDDLFSSVKLSGKSLCCSHIADVKFAVAIFENMNSCWQIFVGAMMPIPPSLEGRDSRVLSSDVTCLPSVSEGMRQ